MVPHHGVHKLLVFLVGPVRCPMHRRIFDLATVHNSTTPDEMIQRVMGVPRVVRTVDVEPIIDLQHIHIRCVM